MNEHNIAELAPCDGEPVSSIFSARDKRKPDASSQSGFVDGGTDMDEYAHPVTTPRKVRRTIEALTVRG